MLQRNVGLMTPQKPSHTLIIDYINRLLLNKFALPPNIKYPFLIVSVKSTNEMHVMMLNNRKVYCGEECSSAYDVVSHQTDPLFSEMIRC